jgi:hypothetical protein
MIDFQTFTYWHLFYFLQMSCKVLQGQEKPHNLATTNILNIVSLISSKPITHQFKYTPPHLV